LQPFCFLTFMAFGLGAQTHSQKSGRGFWRCIAPGILALVLVFAGGLIFAIRHAEPILRARVIDTLSNRFKSRVELAGFQVSIHQGFLVSGEDLRIYGTSDPNTHQPGVQPLISIAEFRFRTGIWNMLKSPTRIDRVYLHGLSLNIPPNGERQQMSNMRSRGGKAKVYVQHFICDQAQLVINTSQPGKLPLVFDIQNLEMTTTTPGQALRFQADLSNAKPVGMIHSSGWFGPWQADSPRDTPLKGGYFFGNADLGTVKGIAGTLSSVGNYEGTLDNIVVDGTTDTPNFQISRSGHSVPLQTQFHAIVDGTSGDTYLRPVRATIAHSALIADGFVVRVSNPPGHEVKLDVLISQGRIEDLLRLGVRTDPPVLTGGVRIKVKFDLQPGQADISDRLKLAGNFQISGAHFTSDKIQDKIGALSMRSQGKPKLAKAGLVDEIRAEMEGRFGLNAGILSFSQLQFTVPGTEVNLTGKYSLDGNEFDFHGKARMQAKISRMTTGWKSALLKPVDPFLSKNGAGTELPVKITGTKSEPHFGLDFGHKDIKRD
jgi:hypothetical protein